MTKILLYTIHKCGSIYIYIYIQIQVLCMALLEKITNPEHVRAAHSDIGCEFGSCSPGDMSSYDPRTSPVPPQKRWISIIQHKKGGFRSFNTLTLSFRSSVCMPCFLSETLHSPKTTQVAYSFSMVCCPGCSPSISPTLEVDGIELTTHGSKK